MIADWWRRRKRALEQARIEALEKRAAAALQELEDATAEQRARNLERSEQRDSEPVDVEIEEAATEAIGILEASLNHGT